VCCRNESRARRKPRAQRSLDAARPKNTLADAVQGGSLPCTAWMLAVAFACFTSALGSPRLRGVRQGFRAAPWRACRTVCAYERTRALQGNGDAVPVRGKERRARGATRGPVTRGRAGAVRVVYAAQAAGLKLLRWCRRHERTDMLLSAGARLLRLAAGGGARHNVLFCEPAGRAGEAVAVALPSEPRERTARLCRTRRYVDLQSKSPPPAAKPVQARCLHWLGFYGERRGNAGAGTVQPGADRARERREGARPERGEAMHGP
jgi:hypothetical protein